ncbi:MAG: N-acetylglucosamine-6-phosphate deacetylase [Clostridia bacterium]|nr:N-acetylglucosamine-6-phosphate deacetylase [Clostridia bacterium]
MKLRLDGGEVLLRGAWVPSCPILWEDGRILAVGEVCASISADQILDANGALVAPGLIDVHTHGRGGYDFATATEDEMRRMKQDYARRGVTALFPTLASATLPTWMCAIQAIEACGFDGIHLEGRYLNPAKRGAHAAELLAPLDADELEMVLCRVSIPCHVSAAFELDTDGSFAACAKRHGATMGLGHTAASAAQTKMAMARGVSSFTHLFNAMPPLHHREGGAVSVALCGGGYAELIVDGMHISPDMIRLAYRCLGRERTVLVTDSMEGTGCADGIYSIAGQSVTLKDGKALTAYGALAGSTLDLWDGVKNLMRFAEIPLADAIACATETPARMVGIFDRVGSIDKGKRADLLLIDPKTLNLCGVIANGEPIA